MASMMLLLLTALMITIIRTKSADMAMCVSFRIFSAPFSSTFSISRISMQKEVVNAVRAESALEKAAAMIPMLKKITTAAPKYCVANMGSISSPNAGKAIALAMASTGTTIHSVRNSKVTGMKAMPYDCILFCDSFSVRHDRCYCIMSWSSPDMTMVIKIPLRNCVKKFCVVNQSSKTKIRDRSSFAMV